MHPKITPSYIFIIFLSVLLSCFFHEFAHWLMGEYLGNEMTMSMNTVKTVAGYYEEEWHRNIITSAGPIFTVLQAIFFFFILDKNRNILFYPIFFFPLVYRFFAGLANIFEANDEGRLGLHFGIGLYTLSILVTGFLLLLVILISRKHKIGFSFNLINFLFCSVFLLAVVFADQYFKIQLI